MTNISALVILNNPEPAKAFLRAVFDGSSLIDNETGFELKVCWAYVCSVHKGFYGLVLTLALYFYAPSFFSFWKTNGVRVTFITAGNFATLYLRKGVISESIATSTFYLNVDTDDASSFITRAAAAGMSPWPSFVRVWIDLGICRSVVWNVCKSLVNFISHNFYFRWDARHISRYLKIYFLLGPLTHPGGTVVSEEGGASVVIRGPDPIFLVIPSSASRTPQRQLSRSSSLSSSSPSPKLKVYSRGTTNASPGMLTQDISSEPLPFPTLKVELLRCANPCVVKPNARMPIRMESDYFEGHVLLLLRTEPLDQHYLHMFAGKQRRFNVQVEGRFKVSFTCTDIILLWGWMHRWLITIMLNWMFDAYFRCQ